MRPLLAGLAATILSLPANAEIYSDATQVRPLLPGKEVPEIVVHDVNGEAVTINPDSFDKPLVLTFYRGGWCPYCNLHLAELRHAEAELRELGFDVWFISPDKSEFLAEGETADNGYTLLSDNDASAAQAFGIAFEVDDETDAQYKEYGVDLNQRSGNTHRALPAPATFLIGTDGVVQFGYVNPDYKVRLAPEVLLAAARAYQNEAHKRLERKR